MTEITVHTGLQGDINKIHVDWFDHNNIRQMTEVEINVQSQDKPRQLEILVNGVIQCVVPGKSP